MRQGRRQGGGMNMNSLMRQAQKMQQDVQAMQEELEKKEYEAGAGGGAVRAVVSNGEIKSLFIEPEVVSPDDIEMLSDLIIAAVNEAIRIGEQEKAQKMQSLTGGIPGMF